MIKRKISIIGNSVALRVRPVEKFPNNKNYHQLLEESIGGSHDVINLALGAQTIKDIYGDIDKYVRTFPNVFILNVGVVDASTREVPLWFYRIATKKSLNPINVFSELFYRNIISKVRSPLVKLRGKSSWISIKKFERYFELFISSILKETNSQIIVMSINEANDRIEKQLPGSRDNHRKFNKIMEQISDKYSLSFVNTNDLINTDDYPDGVHFSISGHKKISDELKITINKLSS